MKAYALNNFALLVDQFSDPNSRTRRRLRPVYAETLASMGEVMTLGQEYFADHDLPEGKANFDAEINSFIERAKTIYSPQLVPPGVEPGDLENWGGLDPDVLVPQVYQGLLVAPQNRPNQFDFPDAILPTLLAERLEVLSKYEKLFGKSWFDNLVDRLMNIDWPTPELPDLKPVGDFAKVLVIGLVAIVALQLIKK